MSHVDAIFQNGVFKPLAPVVLPENQRVQLDYCPVEAFDMQQWLDEMGQLQKEFVARHGFLPDSTPDIAEDRMR